MIAPEKRGIDDDSLELAETLIAKKTTMFDIGKFQDGYEFAVKEPVEARFKHPPIPIDEAPMPRAGNVINLMDALRKRIRYALRQGHEKPPVTGKNATRKGTGIGKASAKATSKRKSA